MDHTVPPRTGLACEADEDRLVDTRCIVSFAKLLGVYLGRSEEDREGIASMASIVAAPDATDDEVEAALNTMIEGLFPSATVDLEALPGDESRDEETDRRMDREESAFASRLAHVMAARSMTQAELAEAIGVGQPAVSMMLSRNCRPQRRTVERAAKALRVSPGDLWPDFGAEDHMVPDHRPRPASFTGTSHRLHFAFQARPSFKSRVEMAGPTAGHGSRSAADSPAAGRRADRRRHHPSLAS